MKLSEAIKVITDQWITVHPNGKGTKGTPVEIDGETGEVLHGMGGKYNGKHISEAYKDIKKHEQGASAVIARKHAGATSKQSGSASSNESTGVAGGVKSLRKVFWTGDKKRYVETNIGEVRNGKRFITITGGRLDGSRVLPFRSDVLKVSSNVPVEEISKKVNLIFNLHQETTASRVTPTTVKTWSNMLQKNLDALSIRYDAEKTVNQQNNQEKKTQEQQKKTFNKENAGKHGIGGSFSGKPQGRKKGNAIEAMNDKQFNVYKNLGENASKELIEVWKKYEDQFSFEIGGGNDEYYRPGGGVIINANGITNSSDIEPKGGSMCHELGHHLDFIALGGKNSYAAFSSVYKNKDGKKLSDVIRDEVAEIRKNKKKELVAEFKEIGEVAFNKKYGFSYRVGMPTQSTADLVLTNQISEMAGFDKKVYGDISDMLEGATHGKIRIGIGHSLSYWKKTQLGDPLGEEAFAEFTSEQMNPDSKKAFEFTKKILPKSFEMYNEIIRAINEKN